jgi:protocatechuate 3,4-dioxygenase beta subunit
MVTRGHLILALDIAATFTVNGASVSGVVSDTAGAPIGAAVVTLAPILSGTTYRDTTDPQGNYTLSNVATGMYQLSASKINYNAMTPLFINVSSQNSNLDQDIELVPRGSGATLSGIVSDSASGSPLPGALVILRQNTGGGGIRIIDSATAGAGGTYSIDSIQPGNNYSVSASLTGYTSKISATFTVGSTPVVRNIQLVAVAFSKLIGKVTSDSANGDAVAGATIILSERSGGGGNLRPVDTATTDATGWYAFNTVETGVRYTLAASMTGYIDRSVTITKSRAAVDTVNITLMKIATGSLYVRVLKRADSTAIVGASVSAARAMGGTVLTGTTAAGGFAAFENIAIGSYTATASMAGFNPASSAGMVARNAKDTVVIYLTASTGGTKTLMGIVTDSASGAPVPNARIMLTITSGGGTVALFDSTNSAGAYSITGIPVTRVSGSITATATNFRTYTNAQVTLGQVGEADTARLNIRMVNLITPVVYQNGFAGYGEPSISITDAGVLQVRNFGSEGMVKVFAVNGKLVYQHPLTASITSIALPRHLAQSGAVYVIRVMQKSKVVQSTQVILQ